MKQRKDLYGPLNLINKELMQLQKKLNQDNLKLNEVMGIEGYASRLYFSAYKRAFSDNLAFNKRTKRPPKDPVNVILSLSYTLLHYEAQRACYGQGLDPFLSILHNPSYGRASLACDLQESLRADVDKWVWQLFANRTIRIDHFNQVDNAPLLTKAGRKQYYAELPKQIATWRLKLREHAKLLVNIIDSAGLIKLEGESV
jgi:CRISPR-associated protein Cas1